MKKFSKDHIVVNRTHKLVICANRDKTETSKYSINRMNLYIVQFMGNQYFYPKMKRSTEGMGDLANQAQRIAQRKVNAIRASAKATKNKVNLPMVTHEGIPVRVELSSDTSFDYIVRVPNFFIKGKTLLLPAKSHKKLNADLKDGWTRTNWGEIKLDKNGKLYLIITIQKTVPRAKPITECTGADVGVKASVTLSDGYQSESAKDKIDGPSEKQKERQRQKHKSKVTKTTLKQYLDKVAKFVVARCRDDRCSLAVESRKILRNLRCGKLHRWARCYFANRCEVLCKEMSVFFVEVNPWKTSKICHVCKNEGIRDGKSFYCPICKKTFDADFNASVNIANLGRQVVLKILESSTRRSGCL